MDATKKTDPKARFNIVKLSGGVYDRGYQYGSQLKNLIERSIDSQYGSWYGPYCNLLKDQVLRKARKYMPFIEDYAPEIAEEIKAAAEGSERPVEEIVMLTAFIELSWRPVVKSAFGCTGLLALGSNGEAYVGQNDDDYPALWLDGESCVLLNIREKSGPNLLTYTYAGVPALFGVNSAGIGLCMTGMMCDEFKLGVPTTVIARKVLQQRSIGDAIEAITRANRGESCNYMIADEKGELYDVETTPSDFDCLYTDSCMGHANHFVSNKLNINKDMVLTAGQDTIIRHNRMNKILKNSGNIDIKILMDSLRDHVNYPKSICRHLDVSDSFLPEGRTFDSMIFVPAKGEAWIARGNPCQSEFQRYSIVST